MMRQGEAIANGLTFATLEMGEGPLALCLHGFPDTAHTWRHLMPGLAEAGYRAVAPFMRGYAPTSLPANDDMSIGAVIADIGALHDVLGGDESSILIGHDWGAIASYGATAHAPTRWRKVVTMAVPPPALDEAQFADFEQVKRSFYSFLFLAPGIEDFVAADDMAFIDRLWTEWSPGYDHAGEMDHVREALADPAHLSAALGYYRAFFGMSNTSGEYEEQSAALYDDVSRPMLYLHGQNDGCISSQWVDQAREHLPSGSRTSAVAGAGHFLHLERPDEVNRFVVDWVTAPQAEPFQ